MTRSTRKKGATSKMHDKDHGVREDGILGAGLDDPLGPLIEEKRHEGLNAMPHHAIGPNTPKASKSCLGSVTPPPTLGPRPPSRQAKSMKAISRPGLMLLLRLMPFQTLTPSPPP